MLAAAPVEAGVESPGTPVNERSIERKRRAVRLGDLQRLHRRSVGSGRLVVEIVTSFGGGDDPFVDQADHLGFMHVDDGGEVLDGALIKMILHSFDIHALDAQQPASFQFGVAEVTGTERQAVDGVRIEVAIAALAHGLAPARVGFRNVLSLLPLGHQHAGLLVLHRRAGGNAAEGQVDHVLIQRLAGAQDGEGLPVGCRGVSGAGQHLVFRRFDQSNVCVERVFLQVPGCTEYLANPNVLLGCQGIEWVCGGTGIHGVQQHECGSDQAQYGVVPFHSVHSCHSSCLRPRGEMSFSSVDQS